MYSDNEIDKMIENDFRFIVDWQGDEFSEVQQKELKRLIEKNRDRFRKHLETHGDISEFKYV